MADEVVFERPRGSSKIVLIQTFSYMFIANWKLQYEVCHIPFAGDQVRTVRLTSTSQPYCLTNFSCFYILYMSTVFLSVK